MMTPLGSRTWNARSPHSSDRSGMVLENVLDPAAYPLAARVGTAAGTAHGAAYDPGHAYRFGLRVILDGLAAQLPGRGDERGGPV